MGPTDQPDGGVVTLSADELHRLSRALVYVVSGLEALELNIKRGCSPTSDAWVLAAVRPVTGYMDTLDAAIELLAGIPSRPPGAG